MPSSLGAAVDDKKWQDAWHAAHCFAAPDRPVGQKFFNFDSGPFTNGALHMGHVRTYVLGDVIARFQRLLGRSVLYATDWDAFGLPNELEAVANGVTPAELTSANIDAFQTELRALGVSYDWQRIHSTCDPAYYRWTQWLFQLLFDRKLVYRQRRKVLWCSRCNTSVSGGQDNQGRCWRCDMPLSQRTLAHWFAAISRKTRRLREDVQLLPGWTPTARRLLLRHLPDALMEPGTAGDWQISKERAWGAPVPMVYCNACGIVPDRRLPILLPPDLDWRLGPHALSSRADFVNVDCPSCGTSARRETLTIDCFFDDSWSFLSCVRHLSRVDHFPGHEMSEWMPINWFHSGFDTAAYLPLYQFVGLVLADAGVLESSTAVQGYHGNALVLADGRKMSKRYGNVLSPRLLIEKYGADPVRAALMWSAGPSRNISWQSKILTKSDSLLTKIVRVCREFAASDVTSSRSQSALNRSAASESLSRRTWAGVYRMAEFLDDYRPNAAIEELAGLIEAADKYASRRVNSRRIKPADRAALKEVLNNLVIAMSPIAPHTSEQCAAILGSSKLVAASHWPRPQQ